MTARETAGRDGKGEDGRARTRKVKLAVFFSQSALGQGRLPGPRPGLLQLHRHLRARQHLRRNLVKAEGIRRGAGHVRQFTILGDGAAWICYPDVGIADFIPVPRLSGDGIWSRCAQCLIVPGMPG